MEAERSTGSWVGRHGPHRARQVPRSPRSRQSRCEAALLDPATTKAIDDLAARLGRDHPSVTSLRAGQLLYRVTDPHDPF